DVVDELPRTGNGKVQKFRLRERGVGPGTWDRDAGSSTVRTGAPSPDPLASNTSTDPDPGSKR
ncbi:MAG: hypothetical protein ABIS28_00175, partial [Caldimonas sp.]